MSKHQALSAIYGEIETVLLSYPKIARNVFEVYDRYRSLIEKLPDSVKFAILAQFDNQSTGESIPAFAHKIKERIQTEVSEGYEIIPEARLEGILIEPLVDYHEYHKRTGSNKHFRLEHYFPSEWSQDPFVVLKVGNTYALLKPIQFHRTNISKLGDQLLADFVAAQLEYTVKPFPFQLEGGNVLVSDTYALIGSDTLRINMNLFSGRLSISQITEYFSYGLGVQKILWIGGINGQVIEDEYTGDYANLRQNIVHIDTFITLGGWYPANKNKELVFVAELREEYCISVDPSIKQKYKNYFDSVAHALKDSGTIQFEVVRIPILLYGAGDLVFLSFNNVVAEYYANAPDDPIVKNIYMPSYTDSGVVQNDLFEQAEKDATALYEKHGFTVHSIQGNFFTRARANGSLRCIVKVLRRSNFRLIGRTTDDTHRKGFWLPNK